MHLNGKYRKNLVLFLLLASVPGIIFSFLLYIVSKNQMEDELQKVHQNHMTNTIDSIDNRFYHLELFMANWALRANMKDYSGLDVVFDYQKIRDIYSTLVSMEGYNPLIGRVELYIDQPKPTVYSKHGYTYLDNEDQIEGYRELLKRERKMSWTRSVSSIESGYKDRYASLSMVHNVDNNLYDPFGSLIVFLDKDEFSSILQSPYENGSVFLLQENEQWLFGKEDQTKPDPLQQAIMDEIEQRPDRPEPFIFHYEKIKYTVTYDYFNRLGEKWYYVSIAPLTNITAPVVFISKLFIYLSLFVFISAILLTLIASRKLYDPIDKLTRSFSENNLVQMKNEFEFIETKLNHLSTESLDLQNRLKQQLPHLKEGFLLQLFQGSLYTYREEDLQKQMQQFGSDYSDKKHVLIFVQLIGFSIFRGRFSEGEEGLVTFSAVNIAEELLQSYQLEADVINFHDLSLGILVSFDADESESEVNEQIVQFSKELIGCISNICKMKVLIGVSKMNDSLKSVPSHFEEIKGALSFRNLQEENQIIELSKLDNLLNRKCTFEYPFDLEKEITHAIRQRNQEAAIQLVDTFFKTLAEQNVSEAMMKQGAPKLLGSIFHIVLQSGLIEDFVKEGASLYEELYKLKDPDDMAHWFKKKVIVPIINELSNNQDQRLRIIVMKVIDMLEAEYMTDISLDLCAERVNLNPSILSKVFKEISGWNFIDYLTNIRLTKAKELLVETDTKIKDVAESIGYNHSYFNRIFKKQEGITPSEFREMNRKQII